MFLDAIKSDSNLTNILTLNWNVFESNPTYLYLFELKPNALAISDNQIANAFYI